MRDAGRVSAVIEVLDEVLKDVMPADLILDKYFKERRYIGAKDRRFIAESVWQIIRHRMRLSSGLHGKVSGRLLSARFFKDMDLELIFDGGDYAPLSLTKEEKALVFAPCDEVLDEAVFYECPQWLLDKFADKRLLSALNETAPVDVRANLTTREEAQAKLKKEGLFFALTAFSPIGLRSTERVNFNNSMTYQDGWIEPMDEASQIISLLCNVKAHHKIIDYCAGAGGKALAFGSLLHNEGVVFAHDINKERLSRIKKRAERLEILNIKTVDEVRDRDYDRFVIDAPCSGSGTWRRAPDAKFRLNEEKLAEITATQRQLLEFGASHTKPGGRLIYITCSVFEEENEAQIEAFLAKHSEFLPVNHRELWEKTLDMQVYPFKREDCLSFSPLNTQTDGFFFACLKKRTE